MTQLKGKVTRLKSKLISNQDQWVETFKSIQEPKQLLMVNAGESTIIDVDESYRHNCLSLYFYFFFGFPRLNSCLTLCQVVYFPPTESSWQQRRRRQRERQKIHRFILAKGQLCMYIMTAT